MYCNLEISIEEKSVFTKVILDTGNFLKDPLTNMPVIVVEKEILKGIIPKYILENLEKIAVGEYLDLKEYISKIRIIPYTSIGKENGILTGIKVDSIRIEMEERAIKIKNVIIGIYNGVLNKSGKYHGLIGLEILEYNEVDNLIYK